MTRKKVEYLFSYKEHIPVVKRDNISTLDNFLVTETSIYCSLGQNEDEFQNFYPKIDALLSNVNDEFQICCHR